MGSGNSTESQDSSPGKQPREEELKQPPEVNKESNTTATEPILKEDSSKVEGKPPPQASQEVSPGTTNPDPVGADNKDHVLPDSPKTKVTEFSKTSNDEHFVPEVPSPHSEVSSVTVVPSSAISLDSSSSKVAPSSNKPSLNDEETNDKIVQMVPSEDERPEEDDGAEKDVIKGVELM